jgi:predicted transcriptional regulator
MIKQLQIKLYIMRNLSNNRIAAWLIGLLILANIATLTFFWIGHLKNQRDNSPKNFLAKSLHFSETQKNVYFELAKNHNENANKIREQIKIDKENLFQLLKTEQIVDTIKNNAALKVSLSIQSLDILTFDHFKKVRALCTEEQKPKFDELIQKMVISVNNIQKGIKPYIKEGMHPADTKQALAD